MRKHGMGSLFALSKVESVPHYLEQQCNNPSRHFTAVPINRLRKMVHKQWPGCWRLASAQFFKEKTDIYYTPSFYLASNPCLIILLEVPHD
jgi:hypothetical protein